MPSLVPVVAIALTTMIYFIGEGIDSTLYLALAFLNAVVMGLAMFSKQDKPFTLQKIVNLFAYIFFVVANGVQFSRHTKVLTFRMPFTDSDYVAFQLVTLVVFVTFNVCYLIYYRKYRRQVLLTPP